jgi:Family of unknown function (DUF5690)
VGDLATSKMDSVPSAARASSLSQSAVCVTAAFTAYFCMYGFRKPFTAGEYKGEFLGPLGYKTILVTAQVLGYTTSKFIGIKVIAEMRPERRAAWLLGLVGFAQLALILFGIVPAPYNFPFLFLNGLPLGLVFGLVLGFLEGRQHTEALTAGLCASFILADGVTKSVGAWLLKIGCPIFWMPAAAGLIFALPFVVAVWVLSRTPPPSKEDVAARGERTPMDRQVRHQFFSRYAVGLILVVAMYMLVTILRTVRADFAPEIWRGLLGRTTEPETYAWSEMFVALVVTGLVALAVLIANNRRAFGLSMVLSAAGLALVAVSLTALQAGAVKAFPFMVLIGIGLYLPYVAVQTTVFERLIAMTRDPGTIGYLVYLADAVGYLGYVGVMLARNLLKPGEGFLTFFVAISWTVAAAGLLMTVLGWRYFAIHPSIRRTTITQAH